MISYAQLTLLNKIITTNYPETKTTFDKRDVINILTEMEDADKYYEEIRKENRNQKKYRMMQYFVRYCLYKNLTNFDSMVLLTGTKGAGKSSFALMLAKEWCRLIGKPFELKKYFAYTTAQMAERIDNLEKFSPLVVDEAMNFAMAENWAKTENKELKITLGKIRTRHLFYILCFPLKIYKIDKTYLESYVNYWIDVFTRGKGIIYIRDMNPIRDAWLMKSFEDIKSYNEFTAVDKIQAALSSHPNFWSIIEVPKPSKKLYSAYLKIRESNVYNNYDILASLTKQDIARAALHKMLQEILIRDSSITLKRLIIHIKNDYGLIVQESDIKKILDDADQILEKVKEGAVNTV